MLQKVVGRFVDEESVRGGTRRFHATADGGGNAGFCLGRWAPPGKINRVDPAGARVLHGAAGGEDGRLRPMRHSGPALAWVAGDPPETASLGPDHSRTRPMPVRRAACPIRGRGYACVGRSVRQVRYDVAGDDGWARHGRAGGGAGTWCAGRLRDGALRGAPRSGWRACADRVAGGPTRAGRAAGSERCGTAIG